MGKKSYQSTKGKTFRKPKTPFAKERLDAVAVEAQKLTDSLFEESGLAKTAGAAAGSVLSPETLRKVKMTKKKACLFSF